MKLLSARTGGVTLAGGVVGLFLGGCLTVGPDYQKPVVATPADWSAATAPNAWSSAAPEEALARWWAVLADPVLSELMESARAGNRDLRLAEARVREARAQRGVTAAAAFPTVGVNGAASRSRSSEQVGNGATNDLYSAGFDASWELDLFGKQRRSREAAQATVEASTEDFRDVLVSLFAEVASNYVDVRALQRRIALTESNLAAQNETFDLTRWRSESGLTTQLDVEQARLGLEQTRATIPALQTSLAQAKHRLAVLVGAPPGALLDLLAEVRAIPTPPAGVAVGLPADLLRRRPDVRRAERELAAQTAQIGVAAAERYPNFTLAGSIGLESLTSNTLFTSGARTAQAVASAGWTLFDGGRIRQLIEVQTALQEQALATYEATVLLAWEDVENALVASVLEQARREALSAAAQAAADALALAREQYASGLIDFQTVLDAQRSLLSSQDQLAASDGTVTTVLIRLYKAIGGGWTEADTGFSASLAGISQ